jgi:very-short-patch-repair endonuclease
MCDGNSKKLCGAEDCNRCFDRSFASHPKAIYWSDKNDATPRSVFKGSDKKYWFDCDVCNHEFEVSPNKITSGNNWCPYCCSAPKKLCDNDDCDLCFNNSFLSHNKSEFWSVKNKNSPREVFKGSNSKYWFDCGICKHEFEANLCNITSKHLIWCPYCSNPSKKLCDNDDCDHCFNNSFLSHERSESWSAKNGITAREVFKSSGTKYWFDCDICKHEFEIQLYSVTSKIPRWCPYCANRKLCDNDDCNYCFNNSFLSHERSKSLSVKNNIIPRSVFKGSNSNCWFDCSICKHEFEATLNDVTYNNRWCPYCVNQKLCDNDDCDYCFNNSFQSHYRSKSWSVKNNIDPRKVFKSSHKKYWFDCDICKHEFEMALSGITSKNSWCGCVTNKTEAKLFDVLKSHGYEITKQLRVDWCRNPETNNYLPFDFQIEEYKLIIELDGRQHFEQVREWKSPEEQQKTDKYKMDCVNKHGYTVIRIFQEDVFDDRNDWLNKLEEHIHLHREPTRIYISSGSHYDVY